MATQLHPALDAHNRAFSEEVLTDQDFHNVTIGGPNRPPSIFYQNDPLAIRVHKQKHKNIVRTLSLTGNSSVPHNRRAKSRGGGCQSQYASQRYPRSALGAASAIRPYTPSERNLSISSSFNYNISANALRNSAHIHSFSKCSRFKDLDTTQDARLYTLPSSLSSRGAGFGVGERSNPQTKGLNSPPPNHYATMDAWPARQSYKNGFGTQHRNGSQKRYIPGCNHPGNQSPGAIYDVIRSPGANSRQSSMHKRIPGSTIERPSPPPNNYDVNYNLTEMSRFRSIGFGFGDRSRTKTTDSPGPGSYELPSRFNYSVVRESSTRRAQMYIEKLKQSNRTKKNKHELHSSAAKFLHITAVLGKLEKHGFVQQILALFSTIISSLTAQIKSDPFQSESPYSLASVYRENFKLLVALLVDEVWSNRETSYEESVAFLAAPPGTQEYDELPPLDTHTDTEPPSSCFRCIQLFQTCTGGRNEQQRLEDQNEANVIPFSSYMVTQSEKSPSLAPPQSFQNSQLKMADPSYSKSTRISGWGGDDTSRGKVLNSNEERTIELEESESSERKRMSRSPPGVSYFSLHDARQAQARRQKEEIKKNKQKIRNFLEPEQHAKYMRCYSLDKLDTLDEESSQIRETSADVPDERKGQEVRMHMGSVIQDQHTMSQRKTYKRISPATNRSFKIERKKGKETSSQVKSKRTNKGGAYTIPKQSRKLNNASRGRDSPGPAAYHQSGGRSNSPPGGVIARSQRELALSIQPKQLFYPGPSDYNPQFDYVSK